MDLRKLLSNIVDSKAEDWNVISGDAFTHSQFGREGSSERDATLYAYSHTSLAAYIPDVSISIEWGGIKWRDRYEADWVKKFPDPHASGSNLDIFFNHALVYRTAYVSVDGGNIKLPCPNNDHDLKVEKGKCDLIRLIDRLGMAPRPGHNPYEGDLRLAGMTVVTEEWPRFH
jgi:hypothetical protein